VTTRNVWDDVIETTRQTTRELFAPVTYVVRAMTGQASCNRTTQDGRIRDGHGQPVHPMQEAQRPAQPGRNTGRRGASAPRGGKVRG
jgi:hypothetical protein